MRTLLSTAVLVLCAGVLNAATINAPSDQPTMLAGIDAVSDGNSANDSNLNATSENFLSIGKRIRILAPGVVYRQTRDGRFYPVLGTINALRRDTIVFESKRYDSLMAVPLSAIQKIEVSKGKRPRVLLYGGLGFLLGSAAGFVIGVADGEGGRNSDSHFLLCIERAVIGGLSGLLGGIVWSLTAPSEKWGEVPLDKLKIGLIPMRNQEFVITASISF